MVELDPDVIEVAKAHFGRVHRGAFDDPRLKVTVGDGLAYLRATDVRYDLVAMDLTDPVGPSAELYSPATFALARRAMAEAAALVLHMGSPFSHPERVRQTLANLREVFRVVAPYFVHIPLYGSIWGFACASDSLDPRSLEPAEADRAPRRARRGRPAVLQRRDAPRRLRAAELRARGSWPRNRRERGREMLKKIRKSSSRVTLVLIGLAGLAGLRRRAPRRLRHARGLPRRLGQQAGGLHAGHGAAPRRARLLLRAVLHAPLLRLGRVLGQKLRLGLLDALVVFGPIHRFVGLHLPRRLRLLGPLVDQLSGRRCSAKTSSPASTGRARSRSWASCSTRSTASTGTSAPATASPRPRSTSSSSPPASCSRAASTRPRA